MKMTYLKNKIDLWSRIALFAIAAPVIVAVSLYCHQPGEHVFGFDLEED